MSDDEQVYHLKSPRLESGHIHDPQLADRLNRNLDFFLTALGTSVEVASRLRRHGPFANAGPETGWRGTAEGKRLTTVMVECLGALETSSGHLANTLIAYLFDYPHERLRDVEATLRMLAEEKGVATAAAVVHEIGGAQTALGLANKPETWQAIIDRCDALMRPSTADGEAMAAADEFAADAGQPVKSAGNPVRRKPAPTQLVRATYADLKDARGAVLAKAIMQHHAGNSIVDIEGFISGTSYRDGHWPFIYDAKALAGVEDD